jgi:zinc protease
MQIKNKIQFFRKLILITSIFSLTNYAMAEKIEEPEKRVFEMTLKNGLKILVQEDHRAPVVVSQIWYKVGSSYEHKGITGVSHVLEHMMFKGSKKYAPGEFSEIIAYNGGKDNAFTSKDYTAYFQRIASDRLKICFELEADRMVNLRIDEKELQKEIEVVKEERRMRTYDKPRSLLFEQFNAVAHTTSPYRNPTIGWMEDLDNLNIKDVEQWYKTYYSPNNATLVVIGDVDPSAVFDLARTYFGSIARAEIAKQKSNLDIVQLGKRAFSVKLPAKLPYLLMGYKVPVLATAENKQDVYALEMLSAILDGGNSARFAKNLTRGSEVAASAGASYSLTGRLESLFLFDAIPSKGKTIDDVKQALKKEMAQMMKGNIDEAELKRVKAGVLASKIYGRDSMFYQAMQIGIAETIGLDYKILDEYVEQIQKVTIADVQRVAKKYFNENQLTVANLYPLPLK